MIRERRNKDKLASYYRKFMEEGIVDPNVHPWVADSWQRCRAMHLPHETMPKINKLSREEIIAHQKTHEFIVKYVDGLYEQSKQHFNIHNLSMLLIDENGYVIKNYAMPFFQRIIEDIQGMRVLEEDVGTSSISIAREHNVPFLMFGPEMWIKDSHSGDACSAPICVNGKIRYIISFFSLDQNDLPYDLLLSLLMTMKYSIEQHLNMLEAWSINRIMMEQLPVTVYWLGKDGSVAAGVEPCLVPRSHQLAGVDDVFNAVLVKGDMLGDVVFYGKGAGKLPTASAVVADVVDALKNGSKVHDSLFWQPAEPVEGLLTDPAPAAYYVRVAGIAPAVVEAIYGTGKVVEERFDGCAYFVEQADEKALAEAARKVEAVGGSVKLVLKRLPEEA